MIGERLKHLRKIKNKTQDEVAKELSMTRASYSHLENNRNEPDIQTMMKLAEYYEVSIDYLYGRDVPSWASEEDVMDLEDLLDSNVNMAYGGESLTEAEKQRVKDILTTLFWDKLQKKKEGGGDGKQN